MPPEPPATPGQSATDAAPTNGGKVRLLTLEHLDGRTGAARRARELIADIESDLGGSDRLSAGQRQLVQRAAVLGALIESYEASHLAGEPIAIEPYLAAINSQRRVLATIGLERRARDVTPTPAEYLARRAAEKARTPHVDEVDEVEEVADDATEAAA